MRSYEERLESLKDVLDQKVYLLCGEDVVSLLEDMDKLDELSDYQVREAIDWLNSTMDLPWYEYMRDYLKVFFDISTPPPRGGI
jgi:hypothetical protein